MDKVQQIAADLLTALIFLQHDNVLHAHLKPDNILLGKVDDITSVKVVDFENSMLCKPERTSSYEDDTTLSCTRGLYVFSQKN